jgi:hypothetical protein
MPAAISNTAAATLPGRPQPGRFPVSEAIDQPVGFSSAKAASLALYDLIEKY